jgi:hypothetical protein
MMMRTKSTVSQSVKEWEGVEWAPISCIGPVRLTDWSRSSEQKRIDPMILREKVLQLDSRERERERELVQQADLTAQVPLSVCYLLRLTVVRAESERDRLKPGRIRAAPSLVSGSCRLTFTGGGVRVTADHKNPELF